MVETDKIFSIKTNKQFESLALEIFNFQAVNNEIYSNYIKLLKIDCKKINAIEKIPFLPIELFKNYKVVSTNKREQIVFTSSGTTGFTPSKHYVYNTKLYEKSFIKTFKYFYGNPSKYCVLGLLPSYLERNGSSLIYMVDYLIKASKNKQSGFYLNNLNDLKNTIENLESKNEKYIVFGVSYALLDLAEKFNLKLKNAIIIETGGMKGHRKEISKEEMYKILTTKLGTKQIHSEYGMTELLSQSYSLGNGVYKSPKWQKILIRDIYDPFSYLENSKTGGINIIDLANIYSCSFIETKDLGKKITNQSFKILGRFDNSDIRGCNLLIS